LSTLLWTIWTCRRLCVNGIYTRVGQSVMHVHKLFMDRSVAWRSSSCVATALGWRKTSGNMRLVFFSFIPSDPLQKIG
jgi:hypothetical protein